MMRLVRNALAAGWVALLLAGAAMPAAAQDAAELLLRLDRLEAENRRLNGQVEQLGHQVRRLDDQLKRFQADVDFRFKDGGNGGSGRPPATPPAAQPATPQRKSDAFDPDANPAAPGAPRQIGSAPPAAAAGAPRVIAPAGALPSGPAEPASLQPGGAAPAADQPAPGTAKGDFAIAKSLLDRGEHEAAEMAFRDFAKRYPKDRLAADAVFNVGESFYRRNRYREAAEHYLTVTTDFSRSARAPEAMLKLGMALRGLGATAEACGTYGEVTKKYPKAAPGIRQAVEREKKRAQCAA